MAFIIQHDKHAHKFIMIVEDKISLLSYSISDDGRTVDYQHTFVPPELRGRHIAQAIVRFALEFAKNNNYRVVPSCPFVKKFIQDHPEYNDLIVS